MSNSSLSQRHIAFTSPSSYGEFLRSRLDAAGAIPLWVPTLRIRFSNRTQENVRQAIATKLHSVSGIAFTSRNGIRAVANVLSQTELSHLQNPFYLGALGRDTQALDSLGALRTHPHCQVLCPAIAIPQALVEAFGAGHGRSLLCPVPQVIGVREPDVVPNFLATLAQQGWQPLRVNAYETAWNGADCVKTLLNRSSDKVDALIFTSTAEAEGLLASFQALEVEPQAWFEGVVIAAHGPVTAQGVRALGITVQVTSQDSTSFAGVVQALHDYWSEDS